MTHTLVIGGTRGIGRAVARRLAGRGHAVSVLARGASKDPGVRSFTADAGDEEALRAALDAVGPLTNLVLVQRYRGDADAWQGELDVSVTAPKIAVEHFAANLDDGDDHAVVLVSSNASRLVAANQPVGYHVAKAAIVQMARYYAVTLGSRGVRVNCVSPGAVMRDDAEAYYRDNPSIGELHARITPLGRMATGDDVAAVVQFLCDDAGFVTGQDIVVDGGLSLLWQESLASDLADR